MPRGARFSFCKHAGGLAQGWPRTLHRVPCNVGLEALLTHLMLEGGLPQNPATCVASQRAPSSRRAGKVWLTGGHPASRASVHRAHAPCWCFPVTRSRVALQAGRQAEPYNALKPLAPRWSRPRMYR